MNIFEALGLPSNHRSKDKVAMKVKHFDEVPDSKKPRRGIYCGQIKKDGIFCHVLKKGKDFKFFSRTGSELTNTYALIHQLELWGDELRDGVYIAELCCDSCSLEELSGIFNPNRKRLLSKDQYNYMLRSQLYYHDYLTIDDFISGESDTTYDWRYRYLKAKLPPVFNLLDVSLLHIDDIKDFAQYHIANGEEGVVIKRECTWKAGHRGNKQMKIVRGVDFDLLCIGVEEGTGKYKGKIANLIFKWEDGKQIKAMLGKGWTHVDASAMFSAYTDSQMDNVGTNPNDPVGKIFRVYALQRSSKGLLRLPKVGELRFDKEVPDV